MHARSWTDPIFQNEYRATPHPSCRACHAPLNPAEQERVTGAGLDGISCAVCHIRDKTVLTARSAEATRTPSSPAELAHPLRALAILSTSEFCAPCHQFRFPTLPENDDSTAYAPELWLQDTYNEWTLSQAAEDGLHCPDCHMPRASRKPRDNHRSHRFAGMRSQELIGQALSVEARAERDGADISLRLRLRGANIGHALPTGDMFRQLVVQAWRADRPDRVAEQVLRRWFAPERRVTDDGAIHYVHGQRADTRVPSPGTGRDRVVELKIPGATSVGRDADAVDADSVHWRIVLWAREPQSRLLRGVPVDLTHTMVENGRVSIPR